MVSVRSTVLRRRTTRARHNPTGYLLLGAHAASTEAIDRTIIFSSALGSLPLEDPKESTFAQFRFTFSPKIRGDHGSESVRTWHREKRSRPLERKALRLSPRPLFYSSLHSCEISRALHDSFEEGICIDVRRCLLDNFQYTCV